MLSVKLIKGLWFKQEKDLKMGEKMINIVYTFPATA